MVEGVETSEEDEVPTFSVICVYNDREALEEMLLPSLEPEPEDAYETILLDNRDGTYGSAAEALNAGADRASGRYYCFVHQDVRFLEPGWTDRARDWLDDLDDVGVAGITGMAAEGETPDERGRNRIVHGPDRRPWKAGNPIDEPAPVQTVDELCLIVPATVFAEYRFDPEICDDWHLYGVEYALRMVHRTDRRPYVLPLNVWHGSAGAGMGQGFYRTLAKVIEAYPEDEFLNTTVGTWPTSVRYARLVGAFERIIERIPQDRVRQGAEHHNVIFWGGLIPLFLEKGVKFVLMNFLRNRSFLN